LVALMDEHGMAPAELKARDWSTYNHNVISQVDVDRIEAAIGAFFMTRTMAELFAEACARNLMLAPANTARDVMASRQLAARSFFVEIDYPHLGATLPYPRAFAQSSRGGVGIRRRAPRLGEHNAEIYGALGVDADARERLAGDGVI
jgi:crotonobetainyl-CoA:carnitine CoA-transferase CaiB-like acyl-CoA transferase